MTYLEIIIFLANLSLVFLVYKRHRIRLNFVVLSFYILTIYSLGGSVYPLLVEDWWLRQVERESIVAGFYYMNFYLMIHGCLLLWLNPYQKRISKGYIPGLESKLFPVLIVLSLLVALVFLFPQSALKSALLNRGGDSMLLAELRGAQSNLAINNKALIYFNNIVIGHLLPVIVIYYCLVYTTTKTKKFTFYFSLSVLLFAVSLALVKGPLIKVFLLILITRFFCGFRVNLTRNLVLGLSLLVALYISVMGVSGPADAFRAIAHRIFVVQYFGLPMSVEVFPSQHEFLGFAGLSNLVSYLMGQDYYSFSRILMIFVNTQSAENFTAGYMSTIFLAEGYAYNGVYGLIIVAVITILYFIILDKISRNLRLNYLTGSLYLWALFKLSFTTIDSFSGLLLNYPLIIILVLILLLNYLNTSADQV